MNRDIAKGNFTQLKGKIKEQWGKLTDDEIDEMEEASRRSSPANCRNVTA